MTILFVVAIVVTIGINSLIALPGIIWGLFEPLAGLVVWSLFMLAIYRLVPNRTYRIRHLWPGVLIAERRDGAPDAALARVHRTSRRVRRRTAPSLALVFLLASWLYFLAEFILLGAVANRMHDGEPDARGLLAERTARRIRSQRGLGASGEVSRTRGLTYDYFRHGNHHPVHRHDLRHRP